jgi:serine/threonine protein kinase
MIGTLFLNRYEVVGTLGRGSMGQTWLARDTRTPRQVVVKVMHDHIAQQPRFRELFTREMDFMRQLQHPYAVALLDCAVMDAHGPCIVMDYIPGQTLEAILKQQRRLPVERVGRLLGQLCSVLQTAHERGIIHRDLKPANLMVVDPGTPDETVRVMDFGLASLSSKPHIDLGKLKGSRDQYAVGTPAYISPEQCRGQPMDQRGDFYSVGVMLFEALTGRLPFNYEDVYQLLDAHEKMPPPKFDRVCPGHGVAADVQVVVYRCLAKFPNERHQSAKELADDFGQALGKSIWPKLSNLPSSAPSAKSPQSSGSLPKFDPNSVIFELDAWMPEAIAVFKLRGFVETDNRGAVLESAPGLVTLIMRSKEAAPAKKPAGLLGWFKPASPPPVVNTPEQLALRDPIKMELYLRNPDTKQAGNMLHITVRCLPSGSPSLVKVKAWRERCEGLFRELRSFLIA